MQRLIALQDRYRWLSAFGLGLLAALGLQPFGLWPLWIIGSAGLFVLVTEQADRPHAARRAMALGWWFGFGYFLLGLYWIGNAFAVRGEEFVVLMPFAMAALPMGLALFYGLGTGLTLFITKRLTLSWPFALGPALAIGLAIMEWLRGHILTGFPWNLPAQALAADDRMAQSLALFGPYGLTLAALLIAAGLAVGTINKANKWVGSAFAIGLIASLQLGGMVRLANTAVTYHDGIDLIVVQPNTDQKAKWKAENAEAITQTLLRLSSVTDSADRLVPTPEGKKRLIIWPETAAPYYLQTSGSVLAALGALLGPDDLLVTGSLRFDWLSPDDLAAARELNPKAKSYASYNGLLAIDGDGKVTATYDKHHLVPFGEYVPLRSILGPLGLRRVTEGIGDFGRGTGPRSLSVAGLPAFSPLICYEVVFPHEATNGDPGPGRAQWMVNVTNDAWYGDSPGPYQHLAQSRMRAIEQGLPLVRAAGTGISAIITPLGGIDLQLALNQQGRIAGSLPKPLSPTVYARYGDAAFALLILLTVLGLVTMAVLVRREKSGSD